MGGKTSLETGTEGVDSINGCGIGTDSEPF